MRRLALVLVALLALTGCGHVAGRVVSKDFTAGYVITNLMPCGKGILCPMTTYIPPCYRVVLDSKQDACLDVGTWNRLNVGDFYDSEKG